MLISGRMSDYEMKQMSAMRREVLDPIPDKPPGSLFKNIFIVTHVVVVVGFGVSAIVVLNT